MNRYKLVDYFDVWGNEEEGWEVNDLCTIFDDLYMEDDITDEDIIDYIISIDYLNSKAKEGVIIQGDGVMIELVSKENGCPIGRLELVWEY